MVFTNATMVVINNKEVQSIKRVSDNAVLYEKQAPTPSEYTGTLSNTLTSFHILNNSNSETIDIIVFDLQDAVANGVVDTPVTTTSLNNADTQQIIEQVQTVYDIIFTNEEFPVDFIDISSDNTLNIILAFDNDTMDLLNVTYTATSATDVTVTISDN